MRMLARMPLTTRLLLCGLLCLCMVTGLTVFISTRLLLQGAEASLMGRVEGNMKVAWQSIHTLGSPMHLSGGRLYAGSVPLNNNLAFVDGIQATMGGVASVFQGDIRITTNVLSKDGTRGVGTRLANPRVRQTTLVGGQKFRGTVDVLGKQYYSGYDPMFDTAGRQVGILYVGLEASAALQKINSTRNFILATSGTSILLVGLFLSWLGSKLAAQIAARQQALETAHTHLDMALGNMPNGLSLWDEENRLVLSNTRLPQVLGMDAALVRPGMTYREFVNARHEAGHFGAEDKDRAFHDRMNVIARKEPISRLDIGRDGQIVHVQIRRLMTGGWIATYEDVTERHSVEARVKFMAAHDGLTGVANRTLFHERLAQLSQGHEAFALLCLDLDLFKQVNDRLGHSVGDGLLRAVGARLKSAVRGNDLVARLGGDEFAIIQTGGPWPEEAAGLAERVTKAIGQPFKIDGHLLSIGVTCGVACAEADDQDMEALLRRADVALYCAKADRRGTFRFFNPGMDAHVRERQQLEADLRLALGNNELKVFYQPLVDVRTGRVSCFEALLRWFHPTRGTVSPAQFIPVAEEAGLIAEIGAWVLRQACLDAAKWPDNIKVAVNISALQFQDGDLVGTVRDTLLSSGLQPGRLELEITESVLLQDTGTALRILNALHDLGVRIAMDDFGTGYSSLSYLRSFPFNKIKIDQSFIREIDSDAGSRAIVRAVTALAGSFGMATVAEGVETQSQFDSVCGEGCGEIQGYLFSKPRPVTDVANMLAEVAGHFRRCELLVVG